MESNLIVQNYRDALSNIWSKNDIINGDQWIKRPDPPKFRHCRFKPIRDVPFEVVYGADDIESLSVYGNATRALMGLSSKQ